MKRLFFTVIACSVLLAPVHKSAGANIFWLALSAPTTMRAEQSGGGFDNNKSLLPYSDGNFSADLTLLSGNNSFINIDCKDWRTPDNVTDKNFANWTPLTDERGVAGGLSSTFVFFEITALNPVLEIDDGLTKKTVPWRGVNFRINSAKLNGKPMTTFNDNKIANEKTQILGGVYEDKYPESRRIVCTKDAIVSAASDDFRNNAQMYRLPLKLEFSMNTNSAIPAGKLKAQFRVATIFADIWAQGRKTHPVGMSEFTQFYYPYVYNQFEKFKTNDYESVISYQLTVPARCDFTTLSPRDGQLLLDHGFMAAGSMDGHTAKQHFEVTCNTSIADLSVQIDNRNGMAESVENKEREASAILNLCRSKKDSSPLIQSHLKVAGEGVNTTTLSDAYSSNLGVSSYRNKWLVTSELIERGSSQEIGSDCNGKNEAGTVLKVTFP